MASAAMDRGAPLRVTGAWMPTLMVAWLTPRRVAPGVEGRVPLVVEPGLAPPPPGAAVPPEPACPPGAGGAGPAAPAGGLGGGRGCPGCVAEVHSGAAVGRLGAPVEPPLM